MKKFKKFKKIPSPYVLILIGPPACGKSTFCREFASNFDPSALIINRDDIVVELYGSSNYNEAFDRVDQKEVDRILHRRMIEANINRRNVIIDMTHMGSKRRRTNLDYFTNNYYKVGVIFPIIDDDEYLRRNDKRKSEENKDISMKIFKKMIASYQVISEDEGFDKIISL